MHRRNGQGGRTGTLTPGREASWEDREKPGHQWDQEEHPGKGHAFLELLCISFFRFPGILPASTAQSDRCLKESVTGLSFSSPATLQHRHLGIVVLFHLFFFF